jgi:hypothetical protein
MHTKYNVDQFAQWYRQNKMKLLNEGSIADSIEYIFNISDYAFDDSIKELIELFNSVKIFLDHQKSPVLLQLYIDLETDKKIERFNHRYPIADQVLLDHTLTPPKFILTSLKEAANLKYPQYELFMKEKIGSYLNLDRLDIYYMVYVMKGFSHEYNRYLLIEGFCS